ncbi:MAG: hypothetical protein K2I37_03835 [Muribaculaceae bacterium]|nr:hypothetical protein [Muribaculaceae bacterium]
MRNTYLKVPLLIWLQACLLGMTAIFTGCSNDEPVDNSSTQGTIQDMQTILANCLSQSELNEEMRKAFPDGDFTEKAPVIDESYISYDNNAYCFLPKNSTANDANDIFTGGIVDYSDSMWSIKSDDMPWTVWYFHTPDYAWPIAAEGGVVDLEKGDHQTHLHQVLCDHNGIVNSISLASSKDIAINHISDSDKGSLQYHRIQFGPNTTDTPKIWVIIIRNIDIADPMIINIMRFVQMPADSNYKFKYQDLYLYNSFLYYGGWIDSVPNFPYPDDTYPSL